MNGMSRVFVGLGLVVMMGFLVVEVMPEFSGTDNIVSKVGENWEMAGGKTCKVEWISDQAKGWCYVGTYGPGVYRIIPKYNLGLTQKLEASAEPQWFMLEN